MSAALAGLSPDVRAHERLDVTADDYRDLIESLANEMAKAGGSDSPHQQQADIEEAEWIVGLLYAAGYVPKRIAS